MIRKLDDDAFAYYVSLGPERSLAKVAAHFGANKRSVQKACTRDNWMARLEKIEAEARERLDEKLTEGVEAMRSRHLKLLQAVSARAAQAIRDYPLATGMEGIRAAEMAIKLERVLAGESSERTALVVEQVTRREIDTLLASDAEPKGVEEDGDEDW